MNHHEQSETIINSFKHQNMKLKKLFFLATLFLGMSALNAADLISRIEPPNWWVGMKNPKLQLLVYGNQISHLDPKVDYPGVKVESVIKVKNPNYLFVNLLIGPETQPGNLTLQFLAGGAVVESHTYPLMERDPGSAERKGFDNTDVMYLITPDRFANGDPLNDGIATLKEKPDRTHIGGRHGGDIEGIRRNLDYISGMGFTAVWLNPVLENDMETYSYHGYSTTDFYKVDPRFGSNESYRQLSKTAKSKGLKMIMDMIVNHCGSNHWWMKDPPTDDWINFQGKYRETNHRKSTIQDPYAAQIDKKLFSDGWFVATMPDMNQKNALMATYLTQNSIWWVEYGDLAGIRMDTYPYPDMEYMAEWTRALMLEYPHFNIVGEEWHEDPAIVSYWQKGKKNANGYTSSLKSLMDFPLQAALSRALNSGKEWAPLYNMLGLDFLYPAPNDLVVFPDNHDMSRIFTQVNEDFDRFKMAVACVLTTRGVPQLYYGTEVLMKNPGTTDHGIIRSDFPGGWAGDQANGFTGQGLTNQQKEAQTFIKNLLTWRKNASAVHSGKLLHFIPYRGIYTYFRYDDRQKIMVVMNQNQAPTPLELDRFAEVLQGISKGKDVISGKEYVLKEILEVPARSVLVLEVE